MTDAGAKRSTGAAHLEEPSQPPRQPEIVPAIDEASRRSGGGQDPAEGQAGTAAGEAPRAASGEGWGSGWGGGGGWGASLGSMGSVLRSAAAGMTKDVADLTTSLRDALAEVDIDEDDAAPPAQLPPPERPQVSRPPSGFLWRALAYP